MVVPCPGLRHEPVVYLRFGGILGPHPGEDRCSGFFRRKLAGYKLDLLKNDGPFCRKYGRVAVVCAPPRGHFLFDRLVALSQKGLYKTLNALNQLGGRYHGN